MRGFVVLSLLLLFSADLLWSGRVDSVPSLPNQPSVEAVQRDAAGNLYVAGSVPPVHPRASGYTDAFVAKLSSDGNKVLFSAVLSGSQTQAVKALALAPDGSILVTGTTWSTDFPVTPDATDPHNAGYAGFFARLDKNGNVVYASFVNGSYINGAAQSNFTPMALATDASGAAYITGLGILASTPGALPAVSFNGENFFLLKLDATGKQVFATGRIGGSAIARDAKGCSYLAG